MFEWLYPEEEVDTYDWSQSLLLDKVAAIRRDINQFYKDYPRHSPKNAGKSKKELKMMESMNKSKAKLSSAEKLRRAIGNVNDY